MNPIKTAVFVLTLAIAVSVLLLYLNVGQTTAHLVVNQDSEKHESKPKQNISAEEKRVNQRRLERSAQVVTNVGSNASRKSSMSSYANGQINGTWSQFRIIAPEARSYGFRVDGSVYDQKNDIIYPISYAGHLWKINGSAFDYTNTKWQLINHKMVFDESYIEGLTTATGTFRMVRSSDTGMQYSDDEGRTWTDAEGISLIQSTMDGTLVTNDQSNRIFIAGNSSASTTKVFVSEDDGLSYSELDLSFSRGSHSVKILRPTYSKSVFLFVLRTSTSKMEIYECGPEDTTFSLVSSPKTSFNALTKVLGTYHGNQYHFYVAGGRTHIYYSDDKGASWQNTNSNNAHENSDNVIPKTVHPTKPNILFKGFTDTNISTDHGRTFQGWRRPLGWDLQHAKVYERKDGSFFHFVGLDFGCYVSDTPETPTQYTQLNNDSPIQMCYDAEHGEYFPSSFLATQDRGTIGYLNASTQSPTTDVRTTDGLRVTLANNETSVWTWMYFGSIYRKSNFAASNSGLSELNWTGNWWAAPMVASPRQGDDAVYVAAGGKLKKFTFNPSTNEIIQTEHYYDFERASGSSVSGFATATINPDLWYVSVENGDFFYSDNGGQTFGRTRTRGQFPVSESGWHKNQHVIKASNIDENKVYYAGIGNSFMISTNGGKAFTDHNNGLDVFRIRDFDFSSDEKFIFAACGFGGIWVYSVADQQWFEMNDEPIPYVNFTDVEYIDKEHAVNFSSYGSGVLKFKLNNVETQLKHPESLIAKRTDEESIILSWEDQSDDETGFIIERASKGQFSQIANVPTNQNTFIDTASLPTGTHLYRIKAINGSEESYYSNHSLIDVPPSGVISKENWRLVSVNSQRTNGFEATRAFDNDPSTMWHTDWGISPIPPHPHTLVIDMNETLTLIGFSYLPRQDNQSNGSIKDYELHLSLDNTNWESVAAGSWTSTKELKEVYFDGKKEARYLKLVALSEVNGTNFASCAEISVLDKIHAPQVPNTPQFVQAGRISDTEIELIWMDMSLDETGFEIERSTGGGFVKIETVNQDETSVRIKRSSTFLSNTFRIAAINDLGKSPFSEPITLKFIEGNGVLSTEDFLTESVSLYPNPFKHQLHFSLRDDASFTDWEIQSISGKLILKGSIDDTVKEASINTSSLKTGIYIAHFIGINGKSTVRILKN